MSTSFSPSVTLDRRTAAGRAITAGLAAALAVGGWGLRADEPPTGDLLKRPDVAVRHGDPPVTLAGLAALGDGDAATAVELPARGGDDVDLSISWGGSVMGLRRLAIGLDPGRPASQPTDLEILVSPDADGERFSVVKSIELFRGAGPYTFDLVPTATRRAIVRLRVPAEGTGVRITELTILGQEGDVKPRSAFRESPDRAIDVVAAIGKLPIDLKPPADEAAMLADGADGRFDDVSFAEAALIASGAADAATRSSRLATIERLVAAAEKGVAGDRDLLAKGEKLLRLLHAGAFKGGYEPHQTDVSTVLETGRFNCVSSAIVYAIVGRRLGLDVRGVEVPEHAFAALFDGSRHVDVETTIPEGFNPARSPEAVAKFRERTGFVYVPESHRDERREVNDAGLVALIYYNHGVARMERGDHAGALAMDFRGLQLDPASASLVKNALAALANWSGKLLQANAPAEAAAVARAALRLAPDDHDVRTNGLASFRAWAFAEADAERIDAALAAIEEGLGFFPHDHDLVEAKAGLFIRRADRLIERSEWQAALDAVAPGLAKLEGRDRARLAEWCGTVRSRWAKAEIEAGRLAVARGILFEGLKQNPDDGTLDDNLETVVQMELTAATEPVVEAAAIDAAVAMTGQLPRTSDVPDVIAGHLQRRVAALHQEGRSADAEGYAKRHVARLAALGDAVAVERLWEAVYVPWAQEAKQDWQAAIERYVRGREAAPDSSLIRGNLEYCLDMQARQHFEKDWPAAIRAYEAALEVLPRSSLLENNLRYCREKAEAASGKKSP